MAALARLRLPEDELQRWTEQLSRIVGYIEQLKQIPEEAFAAPRGAPATPARDDVARDGRGARPWRPTPHGGCTTTEWFPRRRIGELSIRMPGVIETAAEVASRRRSAVDVAGEALDAIARGDGRVRAFLEVTGEKPSARPGRSTVESPPAKIFRSPACRSR